MRAGLSQLSSSRARLAKRLAIRALHYGLTVLAVYLVWKLLAWRLSSAILPQPEAAVKAFVQSVGTAEFWAHFRASAYRSVMAMAWAWVVGFPLGLAMGGSRTVDGLLAPFVFLTYPIPKIVLLPIAFLIFNMGDAAKIAMIALILGYQILVTTRDGVKAIHRKHLDSVRSLGAGRWRIVREVLIPGALPHGFTALRLNAGVSVAVLFFVESFATRHGLGYLIMDTWGRGAFEEMFSGIFGMSLLGVALYESVNLLEKRLCAWRFCRVD